MSILVAARSHRCGSGSGGSHGYLIAASKGDARVIDGVQKEVNVYISSERFNLKENSPQTDIKFQKP